MLGLKLAEGDTDGERLGLDDTEGETETDGDTDALTLGLTETLPEGLADADTDGDTLGLIDTLGVGLADGLELGLVLVDGETDGLIEAEVSIPVSATYPQAPPIEKTTLLRVES